MDLVHYTSCPLCKSADIHPLVTVKDHSISKKDFVIWQCNHCTLRFTQDIPSIEKIGAYYQSQDYISHSNNATGLINQLYQKVRSRTLALKAKLIQGQTVQSGNLLDLGAGIGAFMHEMQGRGWKIEGIEPDEGARQQANALYQLKVRPSEDFFSLPEKSFDAITMWHVLEHVHDLHGYIEQIKGLLKNEGKLFIAVPNYLSGDAQIYKLFWAAYDVPRHLYHFTPKSINTLMQMHGLEVKEKRPMWFDSFYISFLSSKYKNGKTNWPGAFISGLRSNFEALLNKEKCSSLTYVVQFSKKLNEKIGSQTG